MDRTTAADNEPAEANIPALWDRQPESERRVSARARRARLRAAGLAKGTQAVSAALPALGDFAWLLPLLFLFGRMNGVSTLLGDGDTGWHIRTGEWILTHRQIPHHDIFSFTRPDQPWYAWEWLADVLMGWLHRTGGMQAVLLGAMLLICVTFFLLYHLIRRTSGSALIAFALTAVAAGGSAIHWLARPHLFTMLFLVIFCSVLHAGRTKLLVILPLITVLWTNLHGGFFSGILVILAYAGGDAATALLNGPGNERQAALKRSAGYSLTALGCLAASFINPYSWRLHQHVYTFLTNPAYFENIAEFLSISFRHPLAPFFELMLVLALATAFWSLLEKQFVTALLLTGWAHLALLSIRNIPLFMLVAAPQVGAALGAWLRLLDESTANPLQPVGRSLNALTLRLNKVDAGRHWYLTGPAFLILLGMAMYGRSPAPPLRAEYQPASYPAAALAALRERDRIFTSDTWGGYLIYARYPSQVFVDGRSDFYGPAFEKEYSDVMGARYNWESTLAAHGVNTVLLAVSAPLSSALKASHNWRTEYDDGIAVVFRTGAIFPSAPAGTQIVAQVHSK